MLGEQIGLQDWLFYEFDLEDRVPADHFLRKIDVVLYLSWLRSEWQATGHRETELDELCIDNIARFKRPKEYRFVKALPKNNYDKVLKTKLRDML